MNFELPNAVERVATSTGGSFLSMLNRLPKHESCDGIHPTPAGQERLAEAIASWLEPVLYEFEHSKHRRGVPNYGTRGPTVATAARARSDPRRQ